jgi:hypothetical protein
VPSFDGSDDFVGVLGPGKGFWICIDVVEEAVNGIFELLEGSEYAAFSPKLWIKSTGFEASNGRKINSETSM